MPFGHPFLSEMSFILSCPFITTRGQPRSRNFMPRTLGGPKASSPPLRQWAGEPHSWCMLPQVGVGRDRRLGLGCGLPYLLMVQSPSP